MSSSTRNNTFDERYAAPLEASRRGAHRARRNPVLGVLPFALVLVVVLAVSFGAYTVFGPNGPDPSASVSGAEGLDADPSGSAAPTGAATTSPSATPSASASGSATNSPSATGSSPATVEIDRDVKVVLYNASGTSGLARKATTKLTGKDWTEATAESTDETTDTTTVYYGKTSLSATAEALAEDLGVTEVKKSSSQAPSGIVVMIGSDYED